MNGPGLLCVCVEVQIRKGATSGRRGNKVVDGLQLQGALHNHVLRLLPPASCISPDKPTFSQPPTSPHLHPQLTKKPLGRKPTPFILPGAVTFAVVLMWPRTMPCSRGTLDRIAMPGAAMLTCLFFWDVNSMLPSQRALATLSICGSAGGTHIKHVHQATYQCHWV